MQTTATATEPGLDTADLEGIVRLCVNFGVKSLKFRGLEIELFGPRTAPETIPAPDNEAHKEPVKEITAEEHTRRNAEAIEADEILIKEQQVADLLLTDPKAFEEMIANGELDDADDGDESGDERQ